MARVWILRSLRSVDYESVAFSKSLVAAGWPAVGDLTSITDPVRLHSAVKRAFPFADQEKVSDYADQLFQFRTKMFRGDFVVLLRRSGTDVAVGKVSGKYAYREDLEPGIRHARSVEWRSTELPRVGVAWLLLDMPTFAQIYRVEEKNSFARLADLVGSNDVIDSIAGASVASEGEEFSPFKHLVLNLDYARNLTRAGGHLTELKVEAFEVSDVFRAAWVQAVAALDHWVRQEIRERMLWLVKNPDVPRPDRFSDFQIPLGAVESIVHSNSNLRDVIEMQLDARGHLTYQNPDKIQDALALVSDARKLWDRVAKVLSTHLDGVPTTGTDVRKKLMDIVARRNQIAHRNDDNPENISTKSPIDAALVRDTIEWIEQLAAAIMEVIGEIPSDGG